MTAAERQLQTLLTREKIRFFKAPEFFVKGSNHFNRNHRAFGLNTDPPPELYAHILPTARILDLARERLGAPITISSCYRSPAYNRAIGSLNPPNPRVLTGKGSQHPRFSAVDIDSPAGVARLYAVLADIRSEGRFAGGLGRYPGFVHIDTRGYNASWTKR
jgi:uncharacterized protein YcbK (DUF882 family)